MKPSRASSLFLASLFILSSFGGLMFLSGTSHASGGSSGTTTLTAVENSTMQPANFSGGSWTNKGGGVFETTLSIGSFQYWSGTSVELEIAGPIPQYTYSNGTTELSLGYVQVQLQSGSTVAVNGPNHKYDFRDWTGQLAPYGYWQYTFNAIPQTSLGYNLGTGYFPFSLLVSVQTIGTSSSPPPYSLNGYIYSYGSINNGYQAAIASDSTPTPVTATNGFTGWTYSGVSPSFSWSLPSGTSAESVSFSSSYALVMSIDGQSTGSGTSGTLSFSYPNPTSGSFGSVAGDPNTPSFSVSWTVSPTPIVITGTPSPPDYSSVNQASVNLQLTYTSSVPVKEIELYVSGGLVDRFNPVPQNGTVSYTFQDQTLAPLSISWFVLTTENFGKYFNESLGGVTSVPENSSNVIVLQSPSATQSYTLSIAGAPTGTGFYQQLFTLGNATVPFSHYGINKAGSNLQFTASNGTPEYAWIQSINTTTLVVWVKNFNGSSTIDMQVLPSFENLFSETGYLGFNSTYFNAPIVFNGNAWNYQSNFSNWVHYGSVSESVSGTNVNISFPADPNDNTWWLGYGNYANGSVMKEYVVFTNNSNLAAGFAGSGYSFGSIHNNSLFTETQGAEIPTEGEVIIGLHTGTSTPASYMLVKYLFVVPPLTMPTFTIGSSSAYIANATTTGSFQATPGKQYNSTWSYDIYDIPLQPNINFATVLLNGSWKISNLYPSTYKVFQFSNMVLFSDLSGFQNIQITTIQPSSSINTPVPVSVSLQQAGTNSSIGYQYYSDFSPVVSYTPFGSTTPTVLKPGSMDFSLPFGSQATVQILDFWQQVVGSESFQVSGTSVQATISLNVSQVFFTANGTGALTSQVSIRSGSYNLTGGNPQYIQNGSSYEWYTTALDPQTYQLQLYSGIVKGNSSEQYVNVPIGAPISSLIINANGTRGSGLGQIGNYGPSSGQPTAYLYIDGVLTHFGQTFEGTFGQIVNIKITDVLGHTLFTTSQLLNSPLMSEWYNITTPSYLVEFVNQENVNASSPQATQYSSISVANTPGPYYNFTTRVGQWSEVYLAAGYTYFLATHDNLTAKKYIDLTDNNSAWAFNGSQIAAMTQSQYENATASLSVLITGGLNGEIQANTTNIFLVSVTFVEGGSQYPLTQSQTQAVLSHLNATVSLNGNPLSIPTAYYISPGLIGIKVRESNLTSGYTLNVSISDVSINGLKVHGSGSTSFGTVNYNPSNPPQQANSLAGFMTSTPMEILYAIITILGGIYALERWIRRREIKEDDDIDTAGLVIEALAMFFGFTKEESQAVVSSIPQKTRSRIIYLLTSGRMKKMVLKNAPKKGKQKKKNVLEKIGNEL